MLNYTMGYVRSKMMFTFQVPFKHFRSRESASTNAKRWQTTSMGSFISLICVQCAEGQAQCDTGATQTEQCRRGRSALFCASVIASHECPCLHYTSYNQCSDYEFFFFHLLESSTRPLNSNKNKKTSGMPSRQPLPHWGLATPTDGMTTVYKC